MIKKITLWVCTDCDYEAGSAYFAKRHKCEARQTIAKYRSEL